jgi:hypothetical protein
MATIEDYIELNRQFTLVPNSNEAAEENQILAEWGHLKSKSWDDLEQEFCCVILAEAGAGKTEELKHRADLLKQQGKPAFFIRIEDIEADFQNAFEIGDQADFQSWLESTQEAWFFLDSVDESRLNEPKTFEKALRHFARTISNGVHRAHIYITSRPYSWRASEDRKLLGKILFHPAAGRPEADDGSAQSEPQSTNLIYLLRPLDREQIQCFCNARNGTNVNQLLEEIERANLWSLAERPFDLEAILAKWEKDQVLDGRLELLGFIIEKRLDDSHNTDRYQRQTLNLEKAKQGARRLAAAVILTGQVNLNVQESSHNKPGMEPTKILHEWEVEDVHALLGRGIFNDVIYGAVRFRNRDVRELLAAEWFHHLLSKEQSRSKIENLFFREQYGEKVLSPRLRPILPWLILLDNCILTKAIGIRPEIAIEEGDSSRLPLQVRQQILSDIVQRIASGEEVSSAQDRSSLIRIATQDLANDTLQLINEHLSNDNAIYFLGRLVWQGKMSNCVEPLLSIALDSSRVVYARRSSALAVMACGCDAHKRHLWQTLNEQEGEIPHEIVEVLIREAVPENIEQVLISLGKLAVAQKMNSFLLNRTLHDYIARLATSKDLSELTALICGLNSFIKQWPLVQDQGRISSKFYWLFEFAMHAVETIITLSDDTEPISEEALDILLELPAHRNFEKDKIRYYINNLKTLVPGRAALNDKLYWASIERERTVRLVNGEVLDDDWPVACHEHYWAFDVNSFSRLISYIANRTLMDDKLIAIRRAFHIYTQANNPPELLSSLQEAVAANQPLREELELLLNPLLPDNIRQYQIDNQERTLQLEQNQLDKKQGRTTWITELRTNPNRIHDLHGMNQDEITNDIGWLMDELRNICSAGHFCNYANWKLLIPEFGESVALAYRTAAVSHWRKYLPAIRSEGDPTRVHTYSLSFAMAGLEIEAAETESFPNNLTEPDARHALRYITWQMEGLPSWIEKLHRVFPALVVAVFKELVWELENAKPETPIHYILSPLVYHGPWLHRALAPALLQWIETNPTALGNNLNHCLKILVNGGIEPARLAAVASQQITQANDKDNLPGWYALFVDCDPTTGIPQVQQWLENLGEEATEAAQLFIVALMGERHEREGRPYFMLFSTVEHLKSLYLMMHQYIRVEDDIDRVYGFEYSLGIRDYAQNARNILFDLLSKIPGKSSYIAITELIEEHPVPAYRNHFKKLAYSRAEEDSDIEAWSVGQLIKFEQSLTMTPATHRQLFELVVHRLDDLKSWLECGNDSPWQNWQRAVRETEMRTLIAGWLNQISQRQFTIAQEAEIANAQRPDIWVQCRNVNSAVPIELKLLENWTGPQLCERFQNQLVGDYLRERSARFGVMLLVWRGTEQAQKRWQINGSLVELNELASALKLYWNSIADEYPDVDDIAIIVIDLSLRAQVSNS